MSKIATYLREHLVGEVTQADETKRFFSNDASIFSVEPQIIVYPRTTDDIRKVARLSWQLAEKGKVLPITARGAGTDLSGASLGEGIVMVFPAHFNKLLELDIKKQTALVQPGINYRNFQDTIKTHALFLPPFPNSIDYSTIGGAVANNASGERSVKYGDTREYTQGLKVVLANGEIIETGRLSKRELNHKKGLSTFEGEIYRQLDGLISDNSNLIQSMQKNISKNTAGYNLFSVKQKNGSFDITPLLVGSQGTLGIITEVRLKLVPNNMKRTLMVIGLKDADSIKVILPDILKLRPAAVEFVDKGLLSFIEEQHPSQLKGLLDSPLPEGVILIEFDDIGRGIQARKIKQLSKIVRRATDDFQVTSDYDEREELWKIRHIASTAVTISQGGKRAIPLIDDGIVPIDRATEFLVSLNDLFKKFDIDSAVWGHLGEANFHVQPLLDLSQLGDRQKVFKFMDEYYHIVLKLGGSTSGQFNDGRLRAPYLPQVFGEEVYKLFEATKKIFDPRNILNPGVKIGVNREDQIKTLRHEYSIDYLGNYLPRT